MGVVLFWLLTVFLLLIHTKFLRTSEQFGKLKSLRKSETLVLVTFIASKNMLPCSNRQQKLQSKPKIH